MLVLFLLTYALVGVYSAGWVARATEDSTTSSAEVAAFALVGGLLWPVFQGTRLTYHVLRRPVGALYLAGYRRAGDREKALLEAMDVADGELALLAPEEADWSYRVCKCEAHLGHHTGCHNYRDP